MAYGTPATPDDVEAYYTHIRRGRPPTPEQLADLQRRYDAIGGISPLAERTEAQRAGARTPPSTSARPAGTGRARAEARRPVHRGRRGRRSPTPASTDDRRPRAGPALLGVQRRPVPRAGRRRRRAERGLAHAGIDRWHLEPAYLDFLTGAVPSALGASLPERHKVLFTAHSCPSGCWSTTPTPTSCARARPRSPSGVGLDCAWPDWALAWQSAGRTPEPWRGPDILESSATSATPVAPRACSCARRGSSSDHLEVLYDLDIEAARRGRRGRAWPSPAPAR